MRRFLLKHLQEATQPWLSPKSPGRQQEPCTARPRRSPFSSEVCGDFPDGPRPLSSHQFSPLGDPPRWNFEVLTLRVGRGGGVRRYQSLGSAQTPAPGCVQHWKGRWVVGVSPLQASVSPGDPKKWESCGAHKGGGARARARALGQWWLCARPVAPAARCARAVTVVAPAAPRSPHTCKSSRVQGAQ